MWHNTKIKNLRLRTTVSSHLCIHCIIHKTSPVLHCNTKCHLLYIQLSWGPIYPEERKTALCHKAVAPAKEVSAPCRNSCLLIFWLNCLCLPVTQLDYAVAVTRNLNEVVNFELTPFRVTDDVNMCCEFGGWGASYCHKRSRVTSDMCNTS